MGESFYANNDSKDRQASNSMLDLSNNSNKTTEADLLLSLFRLLCKTLVYIAIHKLAINFLLSTTAHKNYLYRLAYGNAYVPAYNPGLPLLTLPGSEHHICRR